MKKELIELRVNGRTHELAIEPSELLLDVLRQNLQLTGSKRGCDDSSCGACTVLVDGIPTLACTILAMSSAATGPAAPERSPPSKALPITARWRRSRKPTAIGAGRSAAIAHPGL